MTVLSPSSVRPSVHREPSGRRLLGAAIVGALGAIAFSVADGAWVAATRTTLPPEAAADARVLAGWVPAIVAVGLAHLVVAAAMLRGRHVVRIAAAVVTGLVALAAIGATAMTVAGVDPFGWSRAGHPSSTAIGILAITAVLYGLAAVAAGSSADR
jgi:hypothetical protein